MRRFRDWLFSFFLNTPTLVYRVEKQRESDMGKLIRLVLTVVLIVPSPLSAADGDLDPTFGVGGIVITDFSGGYDYAFALVLQPDGKIVTAGHTSSGFALARYNSNGSLDTSFGI